MTTKINVDDAATIFECGGKSLEKDIKRGLVRALKRAIEEGKYGKEMSMHNILLGLVALNEYTKTVNTAGKAKEELMAKYDKAGRKGLESVTVVGIGNLIDYYAKERSVPFWTVFFGLKALLSRLEDKARGGPKPPELEEEDLTGLPPGTTYFAPGSSWGDAVIGGPPPY